MFNFLTELYHRLRGTHNIEAITAKFNKSADAALALSVRHNDKANSAELQADDLHQQADRLYDTASDFRQEGARALRFASRIRDFVA